MTSLQKLILAAVPNGQDHVGRIYQTPEEMVAAVLDGVLPGDCPVVSGSRGRMEFCGLCDGGCFGRQRLFERPLVKRSNWSMCPVHCGCGYGDTRSDCVCGLNLGQKAKGTGPVPRITPAWALGS